VILTDREIKIYLQRRLITIDPAPDEDIAYQSTAVDLTLDPTISIFKSIQSTPGVRQITEVDPHDPNFNSDAVIKALLIPPASRARRASVSPRQAPATRAVGHAAFPIPRDACSILRPGH
jgi:deoxycytidine triphosphate deaminase